MSAISSGPLKSRGRKRTTSLPGRMSKDASGALITTVFLLWIGWASSCGGEDQGPAPASPSSLIWQRSSYAASSLAFFICEAEAIMHLLVWALNGGVHIKLLHTHTVQHSAATLSRAGCWRPPPAQRHPGLFCYLTSNCPSRWAWSSLWSRGRKWDSGNLKPKQISICTTRKPPWTQTCITLGTVCGIAHSLTLRVM